MIDLGGDMLHTASLLGSGIVFTIATEDGLAGGKEALVHVMKAQGHLIEGARNARISWRKRSLKMAMELLHEAAATLEEAS